MQVSQVLVYIVESWPGYIEQPGRTDQVTPAARCLCLCLSRSLTSLARWLVPLLYLHYDT